MSLKRLNLFKWILLLILLIIIVLLYFDISSLKSITNTLHIETESSNSIILTSKNNDALNPKIYGNNVNTINNKLSKYNISITIPMLQRSRVIIGDTNGFRHIFNKIYNNNECIKMINYGDSTSAYSSNINKTLWLEHLILWFNKYFKLKHCQHTIINKAIQATSTIYMVNNFYEMVIKNFEYDIIFLSFAVGDGARTSRSATIHYNEFIIRGLLSLNIDYNPLIIYNELSWTKKGDITIHDDIKIQYKNGEMYHYDVGLYYNIPMISLFRSLYPIHYHNDILTQKDHGSGPYFDLFDECCHLSNEMHMLNAILFEYNFINEYNNYINSGNNMDYNLNYKVNISRMKSLYNDKNINHKIKEMNYKPITILNFMENSGKIIVNNGEILNNNTWIFKYETKKKKYGLITYSNYSYINFKINIKHYIHFGILKTYNNIGKGIVWFNDKPNDKKLCNKNIFKLNLKKQKKNNMRYMETFKTKDIVLINAKWDHQISMFVNHKIIKDNHYKLEYIYLHVCSILNSNEKFKILSIKSF